MDFYSIISEYYNYIFPFNPTQVDFIKKSFPNLHQNSFLDIGCATGDLSMQLAPLSKGVNGIDLDRKMIRKAEKAKKLESENLQFFTLDMLHLEAHFGVYAFDGVLCFGNTLVHLESKKQILNFLSQCKAVLNNKGKLLLQIINYDRILDQNIDHLPTIDNDTISFVRRYTFNKKTNLIEFNTTLTIKKTNKTVENNISLSPIRKAELEELMVEVGFTEFNYFGNFKGDPFTENSIPLIVEAS